MISLGLRLIANCDGVLKKHKLLKDSDSLFCRHPCKEAPSLLIAWILDVCDSVNIDGTQKPATKEHGSYGHAQKMRAAATYAFGRLQGLGTMPWHESELHMGQMLGNPSVSVEVSGYMCSLRRRKVQAGEVAVSARAITSASPSLHSLLYYFNHRPENWKIQVYQPGSRQPPCDTGSSGSPQWAGGRVRRFLHAAYTIAFLCLLRSDEVLKIQYQDLEFSESKPGFVVLTLPFRKTHQNGGEC
ncbi:hypothetical protein BD769DRAFT_1749584 [Suillus cothurnatus]|nr:hypothetical protein BD769DRAFT_1749584 [Suillus cothurnatus]